MVGPLPDSFEQSDIHLSPTLRASVTIGAVRTRGACAAFVSQPSGCRALPTFEPVAELASDRFDLFETMIEGKFRWQGLSVQGELHLTTVTERPLDNADPRHHPNLLGYYVQSPLMLERLWSAVEPRLELAAE